MKQRKRKILLSALLAAVMLLALCALPIAAEDDPPHTEHEWEEAWTFDGTQHWHKCAGCEEKGALGAHEGGTATCVAKAVCAVCGAPYGEPSGVHTYSEDWMFDGTHHWRVCEVCGEKSALGAHEGGTANCADHAVCTICGAPYGELTGEHVAGGAATCVQGTSCARCGHIYTEPDPSNHVRTELRGIKAATETEEGYTGDTYCMDCGALLATGEVLPMLPAEKHGLSAGAVAAIAAGSGAAAVTCGGVVFVRVRAGRVPKKGKGKKHAKKR